MKKATFFLLTLLLVVAACDMPDRSLGPDSNRLLQWSQDLVDGNNQYGPVGGFYFIPPIGEGSPDPDIESNMNLDPRVWICAVPGEKATQIAEGGVDPGGNPMPSETLLPGRSACEFGPDGPLFVATFTLADQLRKDTLHYHMDWSPAESASGYYRMGVSYSGGIVDVRDGVPEIDPGVETDLGWFDVFIGGKGQTGPANDYPDEFLSFNAGQNVPIKFQMAAQIFCGQAIYYEDPAGNPKTVYLNDCAEGVVNEGGVTTPDQVTNVKLCGELGAGTQFCEAPTGAHVPSISVVVYRDEDWYSVEEKCIRELANPEGPLFASPDDGALVPSCYRVLKLNDFPADEDYGDYDHHAAVTLCLPMDEHGLDYDEQFFVYRQSSEDPNVIEKLPLVEGAYAGCPSDLGLAYAAPGVNSSNALVRYASLGWQSVRRAFDDYLAPRRAYAFWLHQGRGGEGLDFSLFTLAQETVVGPASGTEFTVMPGGSVDDGLDVSVVSLEVGVPEVEVHFFTLDGSRICSPSGECADSQTVLTDAEGLARLDPYVWQVGETESEYSLYAEVIGACLLGEPDCGTPAFYDANGYRWSRVEFTAKVCSPGDGLGTASVDGVFDAEGEWYCAQRYPFQANLSGGSSFEAEWWFMSDGVDLSMAVIVSRQEGEDSPVLRFDFDDDGDGALANFDNVIELSDDYDFGPQGDLWDGNLGQRCKENSQSKCGELDTELNGEGIVVRALDANGIAGPSVLYEMKVPMANDASGTDFDPGQIRSFLTMRNKGNGATGNTQVPAFGKYTCWLTPPGHPTEGIGCFPNGD
jgi:hypothetical protein